MAEKDSPAEPELEHVRRVKERHAPALLRLGSVTGVGVGYKEVGGRSTGRLAVRVYVRRKGSCPSHECLPDKLDDVPVDVVEGEFGVAGPAALAAPRRAPACGALDPDEDRYDPLVGGISVGLKRLVSGMHNFGTAGLVVTSAGGEPMLLSACHVLCATDGKFTLGDGVCQPSGGDPANLCAALAGWQMGNVVLDGMEYGVDAAVALVEPAARAATPGLIVEIGAVAGTGVAKLGDVVEKRGRSTRLTHGMVKGVLVDFKFDAGPPFGTVILKNQFQTESLSAKPFAWYGDSGSVAVHSATGRVLGLLGALDNGAVMAMANPIDAVLLALEVSL